MFVNFFHELKNANLPVSLREYLTLLEAMDKDIPNRKIEEFYYLSRSTLVKDEKISINLIVFLVMSLKVLSH